MSGWRRAALATALLAVVAAACVLLVGALDGDDRARSGWPGGGVVAGGDDPAAAPGITPEPDGSSFYVDSAAGDDARSGTEPAQAWRTLERASAADLPPGASLLLKRGSTFRGRLTIGESGAQDARIVVGSYGDGARPRLEDADICVQLDGAHVRLTDLALAGCTEVGVSVHGSDSVVENLHVTGTPAAIRVADGADRVRVRRNDLRDNDVMWVNTPGGDDDVGAIGILLDGGDDAEVAYNYISGSRADSYDYGSDGAAIEVYGSARASIHHNVAVDSESFTELGGEGTRDNTYAYNVFLSERSNGAAVVSRGDTTFGPVYNTRLVHNSIVTGSGSPLWCGNCTGDHLVLRNNVFAGDEPVLAESDEDYNLFSAYSGPLGPNSRVGDPQFVAPDDLRLAPTSPAVDAGTAVKPRFAEDAALAPAPRGRPDLGAYEVQGRAPDPGA